MFTAYELMRRRFGERIRRLTAGTFLLLRALAEGVRVFAISIVISTILGTGEVVSILAIVCLTLFYTFEGGMTAVIWTDVVQMFLYVAGAILSFFVILHQIPGGWAHVQQVGDAAHKFQMFDFRFSWTSAFFSRNYSFWAGLIGGCFLTTASHGTEQLLVQRLLAAKNEGQSRAALFSSWVVIFFQFALFLFIGLLLFVHYSDQHLAAPKPADALYPSFVWNNLPAGRGGTGDCRYSGSRNVESQRGAECAGVHHRDGFLQTVRSAAQSGFAGSALSGDGAASHRGLGGDPVPGRLGGAPLGIGAGSRPHHRIHLVRFTLRRVSAWLAHAKRCRRTPLSWPWWRVYCS